MRLPTVCPSCDQPLQVSQLKCGSCETLISGTFDLPILARLSVEEQEFILQFFLSSGSIKEMARLADISYPTMRNKMDDLIEKIKKWA
ncbi:DUF2089 family protein [Leadbetterella byssophila]|jgi:hypothetical protein|uniref:DUF2089 family protein n=1 Tax=Leadbetterella byssophila (strain DSM 17132 / JCM 16389 / KACC 11308 / NBRC 106382 / 4M15) TaxID=649349 RepID=E4RR58_LEAB4|nr:DUF2089 family protein [Leadbetterella byssophila]ADQ17544.1 Protein of unknown function DUF2089 [Leadbetterella byssophila DSM 17132]